MENLGAPVTLGILNILKSDLEQNIAFGDFPQLPQFMQTEAKNLVYGELVKAIEDGGVGAINALVTLANLNSTDRYELLNDLINIGEANLNNFPGPQQSTQPPSPLTGLEKILTSQTNSAPDVIQPLQLAQLSQLLQMSQLSHVSESQEQPELSTLYQLPILLSLLMEENRPIVSSLSNLIQPSLANLQTPPIPFSPSIINLLNLIINAPINNLDVKEILPLVNNLVPII